MPGIHKVRRPIFRPGTFHDLLSVIYNVCVLIDGELFFKQLVLYLGPLLSLTLYRYRLRILCTFPRTLVLDSVKTAREKCSILKSGYTISILQFSRTAYGTMVNSAGFGRDSKTRFPKCDRKYKYTRRGRFVDLPYPFITLL